MLKFIKTLSVYYLYSIFAIIHAQNIPQNPNVIDQQGKRQGKWTILYDAKRNIISDKSSVEYYRVIEYQDDQPIKKVFDFYKNGALLMEATLLSDRPKEVMQGETIWYRKDGSKYILSRYLEGKLIEEKKFNLDGSLIEEDWTTINAKAVNAFQKDDLAQATTFFEAAKIQAEKEFGNLDITYLKTCINLAFIYNQQIKLDQSISLYLEALEICEKIHGKIHPIYAEICNDLANIYKRQGIFGQAEALYLKARDVYQEVSGDQSADFASACNNLALLYIEQGLYNKAESLFLKSKAICEAIFGNRHLNYASVCNNLGLLYSKIGRYQQAEFMNMESKQIRELRLGKNHSLYALSCNNLGVLYLDQGKYSQAENQLKQAKEIRESVFGKNHPESVNTSHNLGILYREQGLYHQAEQALKEAKTTLEQISLTSHPEYATVCDNLAILYEIQGFYNKAQEQYLEAKDIREKVLGVNHIEFAISCTNLGNFYRNQQFLAKAEPFYIQAKHTLEKVLGKKHRDYATTCLSLADLYVNQGQYNQAEYLYIEAKNIFEELFGTNHPRYAIACNNLARLYQGQKDYKQAESLFKEEKAIFQKNFGSNHPEYARSCNNLAFFYQQQKLYKKAAVEFQEASQTHLRRIDMLFSGYSEKERSLFFNTLKLDFESYQSFVINAHRQIPKLKGWIYNNTLRVKGLLFKSTQKTREKILHGNDEPLKEKYLSWQSQKEYLAYIYTLNKNEKNRLKINQDSVEMTAENLEKELSTQSDLFAKTASHGHFDWRDIQQKLKSSEAAIEIIRTRYYDNVWTDSVLYIALIVKPDTKIQPEMVILPNGKELEKKYLAYYRNSIRKLDQYSFKQYWQAIANQLKGVKKVYFSPDGVYHQINLNTLRNPATGEYLLDKIDIQLVHSTRDLIQKSPQLNKNIQTESIILGHPLYDLEVTSHQNTIKSKPKAIRGMDDNEYYTIGEELANLRFDLLPGTKVETQQIHQLFKSKNMQAALYLNQEALEEVVKKVDNPKVLHIATHGFFFENLTAKSNDKQSDSAPGSLSLDFDLDNMQSVKLKQQQNTKTNPMMRSGLVFAGVSSYAKYKNQYNPDIKTEDGILTAFEAQNLNLDHTELVVLSACQTGQGDINYGEGVFGLQRGFMAAGAKTIIMSLWNVSDEATQGLMTTFYQLWLGGKSKREAFRLAQLKMKKKYKRPYFWGAFIMVGE